MSRKKLANLSRRLYIGQQVASITSVLPAGQHFAACRDQPPDKVVTTTKWRRGLHVRFQQVIDFVCFTNPKRKQGKELWTIPRLHFGLQKRSVSAKTGTVQPGQFAVERKSFPAERTDKL